MTYKVTLNGGERGPIRQSLIEQADASIKTKSMTEENKTNLLKLFDALPGTHIAGTIQDNNTGTVTINVTARTVAPAKVATVASKSGETGNDKRPMESAAGNSGGVAPPGLAGSTTAAGGVVPQGSTPGAAAKK